MTDSEGEKDDEEDKKSRKSRGSAMVMSEWAKSQQTDSPELFRMRARLRMSQSHRKFTIGVQSLATDFDQEKPRGELNVDSSR